LQNARNAEAGGGISVKEVWMQSFKHNGKEHRRWVRLYEVPGERGVLYIEPDTPVVEADGSEWSSPFPVIYWVSPEKWFNVAMLCKGEGTAYYCNVASPVAFDEERKLYSFVDYDVDVLVNEDGVYEVVDEEELTDHAHAMKYPSEILHKIAEATAELVALVEAQEGPFDPEARIRWTAAYREAKRDV
jgi:protein associated with RNAse G/E